MLLEKGLFLLYLFLYHVVPGEPRSLRIATVTDVHIGESCNGNLNLDGCPPMKALSLAFQKMNELDLDGVFLTGDLTSSALMEEYQALSNLLDELTVPWWPLLGNHDVWPYERHEDGSFNQTDTPVGDAYLADVFGDVLAAKYKDSAIAALYSNSTTTDWPQAACLNGYYKTFNSWFHNFKVQFPQFSEQLVFLSLDWNARGAALPEPGVGPEAELHDFECGE
jgi:predicted MPP superfamily phosphohydrolase